MEFVVYTFRLLAYLAVGAAGIELLLALFSIRVRRYNVRHPKAHLIFFAGALFLSLFLVPAPSHRDGRTDAISPNQAASHERRDYASISIEAPWRGVGEAER